MHETKIIIHHLKNAPKPTAPDNLLPRLREQMQNFISPKNRSSVSETRNFTLKFAITAALLTIVSLAGLMFLSLSGTTYGAVDFPEILAKAKTLHITGQFYVPLSGSKGTEVIPLSFDYRFDSRNGRYRLRKPAGFNPQTGEPVYYSTVSDGSYKMEELHIRNDSGNTTNAVRYIQITPYQARLDAYRNSYQFIMRLFGSAERLKGAAKYGNEETSGEMFDIWRNEWSEPNGEKTEFQLFLSRDTGSIRKIELRKKPTADISEWMPYLTITGLVMNADISDDIFSTDVPDGYSTLNTKESAPMSELGIGTAAYGCREYGLFLHIGFTLGDGSVLVVWSCRNENGAVGTNLFRDLKPGDTLPPLPAVVSHLEPIPEIDGLTYTSHHFISTNKNNVIYEWALYIPNHTPPKRSEFLSYRTHILFSADQKLFKTFPNALSDDLIIDSTESFNIWVEGAYAEVSETSTLPVDFTYHRLLDIVAKLKHTQNDE